MTVLERLRALDAAATPGPWGVVVHGMTAGLPDEWAVCGGGHILGSLYTEWDNNLVAAMRNALPALLALAVALAEEAKGASRHQPWPCAACIALAELERPA